MGRRQMTARMTKQRGGKKERETGRRLLSDADATRDATDCSTLFAVSSFATDPHTHRHQNE